MNITIQDDFNLEKIIKSGQSFRSQEIKKDIFRFMTGSNILYLQQAEENSFSASCNDREWSAIWQSFFDLDRNYNVIREQSYGRHLFIDQAIDAGEGLRILKQDPWEMLITFIISQRKNIPAISKSVELLARMYGKQIETDFETINLFPTPDEMISATEEDLRKCGLGYRAPYIMDAIQHVINGSLDLEAIAAYHTADLLDELQKVHGVGKKVANCIALFAYGRTDCVSVDVWISRAIQEDCFGDNPFPLYNENAGIIQQYVFYYQKNRHSDKKGIMRTLL